MKINALQILHNKQSVNDKKELPNISQNYFQLNDENMKIASKAMTAIGRAQVSFQGKVFTKDDELQAIEYFKKGETYENIAKKMNRSVATIHKYISKQDNFKELEAERNKILDHEKNCVPAQINMEFIISSFVNGDSKASIAKKSGCSVKQLDKYLRTNSNFKELEAERNKNLQAKQQVIIDLYVKGKKRKDIAIAAECDLSTVTNTIKRQPNYEELLSKHLEANPKRVSLDVKQKMLVLYNEGYSYRQIGKILGLPKTTVFNVLNSMLELTRGKSNAQHNPVLIEDAIVNQFEKLYREGKVFREIEDEFNSKFSAQVIRNNLCKKDNWAEIKAEHNLNKKIVKRETLSSEEKDVVVDYYKNGHTMREIAENLGFTLYSVEMLLKSLDDIGDVRKEHIQNYRDRSSTSILSSKVIEEIIELRKAGKTYSQISQLTEISPCSARNKIVELDKNGEIEKSYYANKDAEKNRVITEIIEQYNQGCKVGDLCQKYGYSESTIQAIVRIKQDKTGCPEIAGRKYEEYSLNDLRDRVLRFYIEDKCSSSITGDFISYLAEKDDTFISNYKNTIIEFCRDLDKIETMSENTETFVNKSSSIQFFKALYESAISNNEKERLNDDFVFLCNEFNKISHSLDRYHLSEIKAQLESLMPKDVNQEEKIELMKDLIEEIKQKLEYPTRQNKNSINNLVTYHYYNNSTEDDDVEILSTIKEEYGKAFKLDNIQNQSNQEKFGQIINIAKAFKDGGVNLNPELANELRFIFPIFYNKAGAMNNGIKLLVELDDYFNSDDEQKYLLKNFGQFIDGRVFCDDILNVFMDKIYKYSYKNIGENKINIDLTDSVLKDKRWQALSNGDKEDFISAMENGVVVNDKASKNKLNIIKFEGKTAPSDYKIYALKIDSDWRILGYQDPNNSKNYIFDFIGKHSNLESYRKNFEKTHKF